MKNKIEKFKYAIVESDGDITVFDSEAPVKRNYGWYNSDKYIENVTLKYNEEKILVEGSEINYVGGKRVTLEDMDSTDFLSLMKEGFIFNNYFVKFDKDTKYKTTGRSKFKQRLTKYKVIYK